MPAEPMEASIWERTLLRRSQKRGTPLAGKAEAAPRRRAATAGWRRETRCKRRMKDEG
jgi:hypothetical protein